MRVTKVNRSAKGTAIELKAIKILEAWGYTVHRCVRTGVQRGKMYFSQSNDVFGCIDLVAKKRGERTRWVQVTAHSGMGKKKDDLAAVPWDTLFDQVEIWRWVGGASRKHKRTGELLERQFFQVYKLEEGFELRPEHRIRASDGPDDAGAPRLPARNVAHDGDRGDVGPADGDGEPPSSRARQGDVPSAGEDQGGARGPTDDRRDARGPADDPRHARTPHHDVEASA